MKKAILYTPAILCFSFVLAILLHNIAPFPIALFLDALIMSIIKTRDTTCYDCFTKTLFVKCVVYLYICSGLFFFFEQTNHKIQMSALEFLSILQILTNFFIVISFIVFCLIDTVINTTILKGKK